MASSLRHIATEPGNLNHKMSTSASEKGLNELQIRDRRKSPSRTSDSELSVGTNSLSHSSHHSESTSHSKPALKLPLNSSSEAPNSAPIVTNGEEKISSAMQMQKSHRGSEWEILEGLKDGKICETKPGKFEGYLMKRRKWPLKGWHKRYFLLDKGILTYTKTSNEMTRGKILGSVDVGLSVISTKSQRRRIDIDAEEHIYHLKVKNQTQFQEWVNQLRHHRLYRQHEISFGTREAPKITTPVDEMPGGVPFPVSYTPPVSSIQDGSAWQSSRHSLIRSPISQQSRVAAWILDSSAIDQGNKDLSSLQDKLYQLETIMQQLELSTSTLIDGQVEISDKEPVVTKKERKRFHLKKKSKNQKISSSNNQNSNKSSKSNKQNVAIIVSKDASSASFNSTDNIPDLSENSNNERGTGDSGLPISEMAHLSCSHPSLASSEDMNRPHSLSDSVSLTLCSLPEPSLSSSPNSLSKYREEFLVLAKEVHSGLRSVVRSLQTERERLKQVLEAESVTCSSSSGALIASLRNTLNQTIQQNKDLKAKLLEIHNITDVSNIVPPAGTPAGDNDEPTPSLSHESSSVLSASEFFDAAENFSNCSTSSEGSLSEEGGSFLSDVSDEGTEYTPIPSVTEVPPTPTCGTGRRSKLPAPKPDMGDFSLCNLLFKNIGKDLSKVSMPVTLNEPLSVLQRLCEELEYCELLDKAAETADKYERMVYIAAFAVSAYSSSYHRAGHKPFNPVLGETFECIREDKGFQFIAEQVSHHPPVSVCHAESKNFIFLQDMRIKTKFWGKSMEILPQGTIHVYLPKTNDHYQWNKVTTCVHNLFSGQRWADQYGEMVITEENGDATCKLTFLKASYWSSKRHEVQGGVTSRDGKMVHNLYGKWTEALYCGVGRSQKCIWRPGTMPEDYELYYGFTRFTIELNELDSELEKQLPPTDTRFRPDQRFLEEGNISAAEMSKQQIEQSQRDRRKRREELGIEYIPMWFTKLELDDGKEQWVFTKKYWDVRINPGFSNISFPEKLW
ncbi:oxysterol-binding protein-related protein 6 isoform X2 [Parasteatoda tepidariorum]|uniref:oxysterol-binding protein-related protein 6 isoform X2 n=1 Tax=Parasteatoda tepidariorum TaxID=114398 RepID=UPI00077F89D0|nr:oxysterol-binding protein-related protein 6 isoform X2 [Parasteatoda tepidariorum]